MILYVVDWKVKCVFHNRIGLAAWEFKQTQALIAYSFLEFIKCENIECELASGVASRTLDGMQLYSYDYENHYSITNSPKMFWGFLFCFKFFLLTTLPGS